MKAFFSNKAYELLRAISTGLNSKQQLGLIVLGEVLGYTLGLPPILLITIPFIVAPALLQPIINYAYLSVPLGIMAYQINKDPAEYLNGHLLNFAVIGGLLFGKKMLSSKMVSDRSVIDLDDNLSSDSQERVQAYPEPEKPTSTTKTVLFRSSSNRVALSTRRKPRQVPYVPLSYLNNVSDNDSDEGSDYEPPRYL